MISLGASMLDLNKIPQYFCEYSWNSKHSLYGYPADMYDQFEWIVSLERRFEWLKNNCEKENTASFYLIKEMIQWGGSQNGTLQKFEENLGKYNLHQLMLDTLSSLTSREKSIATALQFPGMGLTYASKMLRFLDPEHFGALDNRIRNAFKEKLPDVLPTIFDSSHQSMITGFAAYTKYIETIKNQLNGERIMRPKCALPIGANETHWRAADIEMALFAWAS